MRRSHGFVPHECCAARARVDVAIARHIDVSPRPFFLGGWERAFLESRRCSSFSHGHVRSHVWMRACRVLATMCVLPQNGAIAAENCHCSLRLDRAPFESPDKNYESQLDTVVGILRDMFANDEEWLWTVSIWTCLLFTSWWSFSAPLPLR